MPRVVSHSDVEAVPEGGTLQLEHDAMVTPLALERARERRVTLERLAPGGGVDEPRAQLVQRVAERVLARLGDASPAALEAVVAEVVKVVGATAPHLQEVTPGLEYCEKCLEEERSRARRRAVLTTTGRDRKGIVAGVTTAIARLGGNILDISQTIVGGYFTMIIVVDTASLEVSFADFKDQLEAEVKAMDLQCMMMHEDVMTSLHRI